MGCFLGCFGFSSKRKRRKPAIGVQPGDQRFGSYEPLGSASANLDITGEPINLDSEFNKKSKKPLNYKIRKKVSFNLNVQTYEPIPKEEGSNHSWESDDEEKKEESSKEIAKESEGDSIAAKMASYPSNYRYRNCIDSFDEEYGIAYEESDLDSEDEYDFDEDDSIDGDIDYLRKSQEELYEKLKSSSVSRDSLSDLTDEKSENSKPLNALNRNAIDRSQYVNSVLKPVENLSQWKAVKAKVVPPVKRQRKENIIGLEQQTKISFSSMQEIAVDASLSNWLGAADMPNLGITNLETSQ